MNSLSHLIDQNISIGSYEEGIAIPQGKQNHLLIGRSVCYLGMKDENLQIFNADDAQNFPGYIKNFQNALYRDFTDDDMTYRFFYQMRVVRIVEKHSYRDLPIEGANDISLFKGKLLVATDKGLLFIDPKTQETSNILASKKFKRIAADSVKGHIYGLTSEIATMPNSDPNHTALLIAAEACIHSDKLDFSSINAKTHLRDKPFISALISVIQFFKRFGIGFYEGVKGSCIEYKKAIIITALSITASMPILGLIIGGSALLAPAKIAILLLAGLICALLIIGSSLLGNGILFGILHGVGTLSSQEIKNAFSG